MSDAGWYGCAKGANKTEYESLVPSSDCRVMSGKHSPPSGTTFADALDVVAEHIAHWQRTTPENWRTLLLHD